MAHRPRASGSSVKLMRTPITIAPPSIRHLGWLLLLLLAASCVRIMTSSTTYDHFLSSEARERVVFLGDSVVGPLREVYDRAGRKPLLLISGAQLRSELREGEDALVWLWMPGCPGETETVESFSAYAESRGLRGWVVLCDMNGDALVNSVERHFMVGIDFRHYGVKFRHVRLFLTDLLDGTLPEDVWKHPGSIYLFRGKELVRVVRSLDEL